MLSVGPGYLFSDSLSDFNWITWINPNSKVLALITGGTNGLGLNPLPTLDWNRINIDVRLTVLRLTKLAICDSLLFESELLYWSTTLRVTNASSDISPQHLVFRILALQYESALRSVWK